MIRFLILAVLALSSIMIAGAGYTGVLPDIEAEFSYMRKSAPARRPLSVQELDRQNAEKLKPAPLDNENYIDIIIKRDKPAEYIKDTAEITEVLEKLRKCINTSREIQMFNAAASNLIDNAEYLRKKYEYKIEGGYKSYNKIMMISQEVRETALFWTRGAAVIKYKPYSAPDNIYTKENLDNMLDELLIHINETIFILKNPE